MGEQQGEGKGGSCCAGQRRSCQDKDARKLAAAAAAMAAAAAAAGSTWLSHLRRLGVCWARTVGVCEQRLQEERGRRAHACTLSCGALRRGATLMPRAPCCCCPGPPPQAACCTAASQSAATWRRCWRLTPAGALGLPSLPLQALTPSAGTTGATGTAPPPPPPPLCRPSTPPQPRLDGREDGADVVAGAPVVLDDVQAQRAVAVHLRCRRDRPHAAGGTAQHLGGGAALCACSMESKAQRAARGSGSSSQGSGDAAWRQGGIGLW